MRLLYLFFIFFFCSRAYAVSNIEKCIREVMKELGLKEIPFNSVDIDPIVLRFQQKIPLSSLPTQTQAAIKKLHAKHYRNLTLPFHGTRSYIGYAEDGLFVLNIKNETASGAWTTSNHPFQIKREDYKRAILGLFKNKDPKDIESISFFHTHPRSRGFLPNQDALSGGDLTEVFHMQYFIKKEFNVNIPVEIYAAPVDDPRFVFKAVLLPSDEPSVHDR